MQFFKVVGSLLQQSQRAARSLERSVQEVVEVLQPGPLGATAARWDTQRRADAEKAVQQALDNWQALQQQQQQSRQQQQEQWPESAERHEVWHAQQQHGVRHEQDWQHQDWQDRQQQRQKPHGNG